ncbi:MAG: 4Fe-4S dicluster domain-containing protein, partial [Bacteroidales bacterium]|nr:4Fe-4S dicluster domain-containing protein [Bacteroidales bacterium]
HGSMSGEHGDGRLRGEFIPIILGDRNYELLKELKKSWDPLNIFNPGKIVDTPRMNTSLRYIPGQITPDIKTIFDFSDSGGIVRAAEKCNGSGDCRKTEKSGGTMCPSYMATRDERASTRGRANLLRELLSLPEQEKPFDHKELYEILDLCLSCKGCKSECPSSVDVAKMKAEFLQHYYDDHGIPLRTRVIANISKINSIGAFFPAIFNLFAKSKVLSFPIKRILKFAVKRSIPAISTTTLRKWVRQNLHKLNPENPKNGTVYLFIDEFTNYNDTEVGIKAIRLLQRLGYQVVTTPHGVSGRTFLSKGLLRKARNIAEHNVRVISDFVSQDVPLVGLEPSAILGFRDEYPELVGRELAADARKMATHALTLEEFLDREMDKGLIPEDRFTKVKRHIKLHGHCQQKAVSTTASTIKVLSWPAGYTVEEIPSGCCGMAGSFGYEKEHYELSMKVGELVLFPAIRKTVEGVMIAAPGTSCRHQIKDGTGRRALHPAEILHDALV